MPDEVEMVNGQVMWMANQFEWIVRIWDAHCRGDSDTMRGLLETEILLISKNVEMWAELPLDSARRSMVSGLLQELLAGLERNGNVITEIEIGGASQILDCVATCRKLLRHFGEAG